MPDLTHIEAAFDLLHGPGSPFATGPTEVSGRPHTTYINAPDHVRDLWLACKATDDEIYLVYEDERITYGEARVRVLRVANALIADFSVQPGDSVGLSLRNYPEWILGWWAIQMAGGTAVQLNSFWNAEELAYGIVDSGSAVVIVDEHRYEQLTLQRSAISAKGVEPRAIVVRRDGDLGGSAGDVDWLELDGGESLPEITIGPDDRSVIVYTSGTTALPKGVVHSQRNVVTNHFNMVSLSLGLRLAEVAARGGDPVDEAVKAASAPQNVMLVAVPLFHVTGSHCVMLPLTATGGRLVLMYKWDPAKALELIEREQVTNFTGVPTMTMDMLASPDFASRDTSSLKSMGSGGAPNPPHMVDRVGEKVANATVTQGYGLSEVSGIAAANAGMFYAAKPGSAGVGPRVGEMRVVDEAGVDVAVGERGELLIRGPHVFVEYHNQPEATAAAIDPDGWFSTGDIARIDSDGFLSIVDRAKDVVIRGGENVGSAEVEAAIARHPAVHECAVFGVAHERLGEEVAVAVFPLDGASIDIAELREFAATSLAAFKVPAHVFVYTEALPKNANGKVLKRLLREQAENV